MSAPALLLSGIATVLLFGAVVQVEGARRPGYDPRYHTGSELELGPAGWIMRVNFFVVGLGLLAFAAGVRASLDADVAAALLAVSALALVLAGVFAPDPVRGFPLGADTTGRPATTAAKVHYLMGPLLCLSLAGACVAVAGRLDGLWAGYSVLTAVAGLALTGRLIALYRRDAANTGLAQRQLLSVFGVWVVVLGLALVVGAAD